LSKAEIGVLLVCLFVLVVASGAVGQGGRRRAKEAVCLSNLRCWGNVFDAFARDNDNHFVAGEGASTGMWWIGPLESYWGDRRLLLCPVTVRPAPGRAAPRWAAAPWQTNNYVGSYGINGWVRDLRQSSSAWGYLPRTAYWRTVDDPAAHMIPVFADMWWPDAWPRETDIPPATEGPSEVPFVNEMQRVCIDRHNGSVNCLFMDWSARKVGLKELWTLKWHRDYNTGGQWTKAGGVTPSDWPQWMQPFKDF
jgi:prepilin-type processing-associated H-X9-DG protein